MPSKLIDLIRGYKSLAIIGMEKNTGKTTTLNNIIENADYSTFPLGLTSIGRDGEERDIITSHQKPRIYVRKDTYIATAKNCLFKGDITREIVEASGIETPLGEIIIAKALSDGYVELAGPSTTTQIKYIKNRLRELGCKLVIIDGALSRKTSASPGIADAAILCTGAALSANMYEVVEKTKHTVELLTTEAVQDSNIRKIINTIPENSRVSVVKEDYSVISSTALNPLATSEFIVHNLVNGTRYFVIKGVITNKLLEAIMKTSANYKNITFICEDGTKLFVTSEVLNKFKRQGGNLRVINPINLIAVSCNPTSPFGYEFNQEIFLNKMRSLKVQVF